MISDSFVYRDADWDLGTIPTHKHTHNRGPRRVGAGTSLNAGSRPEQQVGTAGASPRRVLCADRHAPLAAALAARLRRAGFDARGCADGAGALVAVTDFRPHGCVFDLETARVGGCELAQWVRSELGDRVILIGAADQITEDLERTAVEAGFDLLLDRPADAVLIAGLLAGPGAPE
jgi:CheY-like chemotaxis protein